jgi:hypothetical protein
VSSAASIHRYATSEALRSMNVIVYSTPMSTIWLLGIWRLMRADASLDFAPGVRMEFLPDGVLRYHVDVGGQDQVVDLVYRVEGDLLLTENPEAPHSMSVRIEHGAGDVLLLDFGGAQAMLVREVEHPARYIQ